MLTVSYMHSVACSGVKMVLDVSANLFADSFLMSNFLLYSVFKVQARFSPLRSYAASGDGEIRTLDPLLARQVLSQLSYAPIFQNGTFIFYPVLLFLSTSFLFL